jgi:hypothetical protein
MVDPVTITAAVSAASSAFTAIQRGFAAARSIEDMTKDVSRWMSAVSDVDHLEKSAKNPSLFLKMTKGKSIESLALEAYTAKVQLEDQRKQLKSMISALRGPAAWAELVALEGKIRRQRQEAIYAARQRRQKIIEYCAWTIVVGAGLTILTAFVMLLKAHTANAADPEFVACRLVGCTVVDKDRICVYRGANHTQDVLYYSLDEWFPREFQCKYAPNETPPPTVQEVLKAIKDKMS